MPDLRPALRLGLDGSPIRDLLARFGLLLLIAGCAAPPAASTAMAGDRMTVIASTTVFADLVAQVGGDRVVVIPLVPKGGEVHTFDPSPSDLRAVADADLVVMNGLGLDGWAQDLVADSGSDAIVVELAEDLPEVTYIGASERDEAHGTAHDDEPSTSSSEGHGHEEHNPHLWLDIAYAQRYVERIADALATADPDDATAYAAGAAAYLERLEALDTWARDRLGSVPERDRVIVSFHEALPYLARAYDLTIVGSIVDAPGQDPSAGEIAALVDAIRASGARAVFGEVQSSPDLVETVAAEAGVPVEVDLHTDSLGDPPADTYEGMMRWTIDRIATALER